MENFRIEAVQKFIDALHSDKAPFQTGKVEGQIEVRPFAASSNKPFYGANSLILQMRAQEEGYDDPRWMTLNQADQLGYQIKDGEYGTPIEIWSRYRDEPKLDDKGEYIRDADGNIETNRVELSRPQVSYVTMFNAEQIDGIPEYNRHADLTLGKNRTAIIADVLDKADMNVVLSGDGEVGYNVAEDTLKVPSGGKPAEQLANHRAVLKDLGYATIYEHRLDRSDLLVETPENAAKEELRVTLAAGRIAGATGLGAGAEIAISDEMKPAVIALLESDTNELFRASRDADQIARWYLEPEARQQMKDQRAMNRAAQSKQTADREAMKPENRHFLSVPYDDRHEIRALGGIWHRDVGYWSVAKTIDPKKIDKWDIADLKQDQMTPMQEFGDWIRNAGYVLEGDAVMDGEFHRIERAESAGNEKPRTATYCGWVDGKPNGLLSMFNGEQTVKEKWVATGQSLSPNQVVALQQDYEKTKADRNAGMAKARSEAATKAHGMFSNATWANATNCAFIAQNGIEGDTYTKVSKEGRLLVPARDIEGQIHNLQIISKDGTVFLRGGRKDGCFHEIRARDGNAGNQVIVTKDIADAAVLRQATGRSVFVAFDVNNMPSVVGALRQKFPQGEIAIATGAVDEFTQKKINKAAERVGGKVITADAPSFVDLRNSNGIEAVREQANAVLRPDLAEAETKSAAKGRSR